MIPRPEVRWSFSGSTESGKSEPATGTFGSDLLFYLKSSRPGFWLTAAWFYMLPLAQQNVFRSSAFWIGLFYVTFPLGILIYGWNDIMDAETDRHNSRKGTFLFGARGTAQQLRQLPIAIFLVHLPFLIGFALWRGPRMCIWYGALILATALYNLPRVGFKNFPFVDMLNQIGYVLVFYLSSNLNGVAQLPWMTFLFGAFFAMHSHLLGQIMDVVPDRLAGRLTTANVIGVVRAKYLLSTMLLLESALVFFAFKDFVVGSFLAVGALWFVLDVTKLFRDQSYPIWLTRLFLLGWNIMAIGSAWWVWSTGALSRLAW
ncbi:MAG: UbiA family prenyltransferase [Verrucomicrobiota bacterium]